MNKILKNDNSKEIKFLTIPEQISLLRNNGLIISDEKFAAKLLKQIGYYKLINGYKFPFIDQNSVDKKYINGTTLDHLYELYKFDLVLESIVFRAATLAEITLKSYMVELISQKYGISLEDYLKPEHYLEKASSKNTFSLLQEEILKELDRQIKSNHPAILWYKENYDEDYPFWVLSNILSLGTIGRWFALLLQNDKAEIAKEYRLMNIPSTLQSFIIHLTFVRNICAHNDVLCLHRHPNAIPTKFLDGIYTYVGITEKYNNQKDRYIKGTKDFMASLIVLRYMIHDNEQYSNIIDEIKTALDDLKNKISDSAYNRLIYRLGLVDNWFRISEYKVVT